VCSSDGLRPFTVIGIWWPGKIERPAPQRGDGLDCARIVDIDGGGGRYQSATRNFRIAHHAIRLSDVLRAGERLVAWTLT